MAASLSRDLASDPIKAKIAHAEKRKVCTKLLLGKRDFEAGHIAVRVHWKGNLDAKSPTRFCADLLGTTRIDEAEPWLPA